MPTSLDSLTVIMYTRSLLKRNSLTNISSVFADFTIFTGPPARKCSLGQQREFSDRNNARCGLIDSITMKNDLCRQLNRGRNVGSSVGKPILLPRVYTTRICQLLHRFRGSFPYVLGYDNTRPGVLIFSLDCDTLMLHCCSRRIVFPRITWIKRKHARKISLQFLSFRHCLRSR